MSFVRSQEALSEHGVDEVLAHLSCLEATLLLKGGRRRTALKRKCVHLVDHPNANQWLDDAYQLRDYMHSLADPGQRLSWSQLARTRWLVATAVGRYLDLAVKKPELNRSELLRQLDR